MQVYRLENMTKGWFVGSFAPTALATDKCEVAIKRYAAGDREDRHHHRLAVELTAVVVGRVRMFDREYDEGDIIRVEPGDSTAFEALSDVVTVVVKLPSVAGDKYPG